VFSLPQAAADEIEASVVRPSELPVASRLGPEDVLGVKHDPITANCPPGTLGAFSQFGAPAS